MRHTGYIHYQLEFGEGQVGVISTWSVPYSAFSRRGIVEEVEADGMPTLTGLELKVGQTRRTLELPGPDEQFEWQLAWIKQTKHCDAELLERFTNDCLERHWENAGPANNSRSACVGPSLIRPATSI